MNKELEMNISMQAKNERRTEESHRSLKEMKSTDILHRHTTADDKNPTQTALTSFKTHNRTARTTLFPRFALHFSSVVHSSSRWCVYYAAQRVRAPTTSDIAVFVNN